MPPAICRGHVLGQNPKVGAEKVLKISLLAVDATHTTPQSSNSSFLRTMYGEWEETEGMR